MNLPKIVLAGRPNVGKSALFNRLIGRRKAIVESHPGTTRDWQEEKVCWRGADFILIDTGGMIPASDDREGIQARVTRQSEKAIQSADGVVFVTDGQAGLTPLDEILFQQVRRMNQRIIIAVNKVDHSKEELSVNEFYRLTAKKREFPLASLSALHGKGIGDLLDQITGLFPKGSGDHQEIKGIPRVAIIGRPNVGKSTLVNQWVQEERVLVDQTPGTTRDSIEIPFSFKEKPFILIDTAGIQHVKKAKEAVEIFSVARTKKAIQKSDIVLFLLDASQGVIREDLRIVQFIHQYKKPCLILLNKWDLVQGVSFSQYSKRILERMSDIDYVPILKISALTGMGSYEVFPWIGKLLAMNQTTTATSQFNKALSLIQQDPAAPRISIPRPLKFYYGCQVGKCPQSFRIVANFPEKIPRHYQGWFIKQLRGRLRLDYVPLQVEWAHKSN